MLTTLSRDIPQSSVHLDDVVYFDVMVDHVSRLKTMFERLAEANLTLNPDKCELGTAMVVGHGQVHQVDPNVATDLELSSSHHQASCVVFWG